MKDPISIAISNFAYCDTECIYENNDKLYLGGKSGVTVVDYNLNFLAKIIDKSNNIISISKWKDNILTVGDDKMMKLYDDKVLTYSLNLLKIVSTSI